MPPGVAVKRWWIVSNEPLIIGYEEQDKPTVDATLPAPPESGGGHSGVSINLADADLFRNVLSERFLDPSLARDEEVLSLLRDTLKDYLQHGDPQVGGPRTPTAHGPSHGASGFDPVLISVHQVIGLAEWMTTLSGVATHLQDINGYFSEVAGATGQLYNHVLALSGQADGLSSSIAALSGQYVFLRGAFNQNVADQMRLQSLVAGVTASQEEVKTFLSGASALMATIKNDFPKAWTDEFEAGPQLRYPLSHVPLTDHPIRLWVSGLRNPRMVFEVEGNELVFAAASAAPLFDPSADGIKDYIVVDYYIPYQ